MILERNTGNRTALSFQRSTILENFRNQLAQGEVVAYIRSFREALDLRRQTMATSLQVLDKAFTSLGEATLLVATSGAVVRMSELASTMLDNRQGLCIRQGRLFHPLPSVLTRLSKTFEETLRSVRHTKVTVALDWGETLSLDIAPSPPQLLLSNEPLVFVRLRRNSAFNETKIVDLVCTFGVTTAEAKVLAGLVAGLTPVEYAVQNGVSKNTVRTQIANLKTKMRCSRIVDLVRLAVLAQI